MAAETLYVLESRGAALGAAAAAEAAAANGAAPEGAAGPACAAKACQCWVDAATLLSLATTILSMSASCLRIIASKSAFVNSSEAVAGAAAEAAAERPGGGGNDGSDNGSGCPIGTDGWLLSNISATSVLLRNGSGVFPVCSPGRLPPDAVDLAACISSVQCGRN